MIGALPAGIFRIGDGLINFYAIEEGGRLTLVDTGMLGDWGLLKRWLAARGRTAADIEVVIVTHAHRDHVGGARRVEKETGASVRIHEADRTYAANESGSAFGPGVPGEGRAPLGRGIPVLLLRAGRNLAASRSVRYAPPEQLIAVHDGELLDIPGRPRVVHTPGHTPGSACYHIPEHDVLFTGDALITLDVARARRGPRLSPPGINYDSAQAAASLRRIEALRASVLLPGHGAPYFGSPAAAVAEARRLLAG